MKHPDAQRGVKLIYMSMVLMVGNEVFDFLKSLMESQLFALDLVGIIFEVIADILLIAGIVMQLVGLGIAKKDDKGYTKAFLTGISGFIFVFVIAIVQSILVNMFAMDIAMLSNISQLVYSVLALIVDYLIIKTTIQLLVRNHFEEKAKMGEIIWRTIFILFLIAIILGLAAGSFLSITVYYGFSNANIVANLICLLLEVVMGILEIIAYAKFRKYLKHVYMNL